MTDGTENRDVCLEIHNLWSVSLPDEQRSPTSRLLLCHKTLMCATNGDYPMCQGMQSVMDSEMYYCRPGNARNRVVPTSAMLDVTTLHLET